MATSKASASWEGKIKGGHGVMKPAHATDVPYSVGSRFEGQQGSNPEEMIGAALAGCFSMALSLGLEQAGFTPKSIRTNATVHLEKDGPGFTIPRIELVTEVSADADESKFKAVAEETKKQCPVSKVLKGAEITLEARLVR